ncbi:MAG: SDR family oxidoreductase [Myxococcota bacterium]
MAQVVIAGCGYLGTELAQRLLEAGHEVFGIRRDASKLADEIHAITGDVAEPKSLGPAPKRVDFAVFAVSADEASERAYRRAYLDGLAGFLEWLADEGQRPKRLLMVSSTSVYGQRRGELIDEDSPTHPIQFRGETLLASERLAAASGIPTTVVRLGGIYGPGREGLIDRALAGKLEVRSAEHFTNRIHRDDAAGLLHHLLFHPSPDALYLGVDDEPAEEAMLFDWLTKELGVGEPGIRADDRSPDRSRAVGSKRCDNHRLRESGYQFRYPTFREGYGELIRARAQT